eukprot:SAG22_NODE_188_length_15821_cov_38.313319_7_plen_145_part_00
MVELDLELAAEHLPKVLGVNHPDVREVLEHARDRGLAVVRPAALVPGGQQPEQVVEVGLDPVLPLRAGPGRLADGRTDLVLNVDDALGWHALGVQRGRLRLPPAVRPAVGPLAPVGRRPVRLYRRHVRGVEAGCGRRPRSAALQ